MGRKSWKEKRNKTAKRTKKSADNREAKSSSMFTFKAVPDKEVRWADKPQKGRDDNRYDILPFPISQEWYAEMRTFYGKPTGLEVGDVDYKLEYASHSRIGPEKTQVLCLRETFGQACPVCEERDRLQDNQDEEDPDGKLADGLKPKWRTLYNIIDLNGDEDICLWDYSYHLFEKELLEEVSLGDEGLQYHWDLEEGQTVVWRGKEKKWAGYKFIEAKNIKFEKRAGYNESILDEVYPLDLLLNIPTYDDVGRILTGTPEEDATPNRGKQTEEKKTRSRGSRYQKDKPEEKEPEDPPDDTGGAPWNKDDDKCEDGLTLGVDFQTDDKCKECPDENYNACEAEAERLAEEKEEAVKAEKEKAEKEKVEKEKKEQSSTRTRRTKKDEDKSGGRTRKRSRR